MRFFIVDDDEAIRSMLSEFIEDYDLGEVVGEAEHGALVDAGLLAMKEVDIVIIDLLMPVRDGIETVRAIKECFNGRIIMLSQVEDKEMVGNAYALGVHNYITKPINRLEVISVIKNVAEHIRLQKAISSIKRNLYRFSADKHGASADTETGQSLLTAGQHLLAELGMAGESGSKDLLDILEYLCIAERSGKGEFPALKDIFSNVAVKRLGPEAATPDGTKKEIKAIEQRVRRAIFQGLKHLASLGITDYGNPKFEEYASVLFEFAEVRKIMLLLQNNKKPAISDSCINTKRFVKLLFMEAKKRQ